MYGEGGPCTVDIGLAEPFAGWFFFTYKFTYRLK